MNYKPFVKQYMTASVQMNSTFQEKRTWKHYNNCSPAKVLPGPKNTKVHIHNKGEMQIKCLYKSVNKSEIYTYIGTSR